MFLLRRAGLVKVQGLLREGFSLPMGLDVSRVGSSLAQLTFTTLTCSCKGYVSFRATCDITGTSHRSTATNQCGPGHDRKHLALLVLWLSFQTAGLA